MLKAHRLPLTPPLTKVPGEHREVKPSAGIGAIPELVRVQVGAGDEPASAMVTVDDVDACSRNPKVFAVIANEEPSEAQPELETVPAISEVIVKTQAPPLIVTLTPDAPQWTGK